MSALAGLPTRFVGIDLHKTYVVVGAVDAHQQVVLKPRRLTLAAFEAWATQHLGATDAVVLEATTNTWYLVDLLQPHVASITVAHPVHVKHITAAKVKTDARDAIKLAKLLAANLIPEVWIPPVAVRELRALLAHHRHLIRPRTQARNRLRSVLHRHNIIPPTGEVFSVKQRSWWTALPLSPVEQLRVRQNLAQLDALAPLLTEVEAELARLSVSEPWKDAVPLLLQLPGVGLQVAMTLLAAIGDITRFPSAKKLVGYSGLGVGVHDSGQTRRTGRITKEGRRELRTMLVEAAWQAVRYHAHWKAQFERLAARIGTNKAIVAVARKLLVVVWHVLTHQVTDQYADAAAVGRTFAQWASRHRVARHAGVSRQALVRQQMTRLDLLKHLDQFVYNREVFDLRAPG